MGVPQRVLETETASYVTRADEDVTAVLCMHEDGIADARGLPLVADLVPLVALPFQGRPQDGKTT